MARALPDRGAQLQQAWNNFARRGNWYGLFDDVERLMQAADAGEAVGDPSRRHLRRWLPELRALVAAIEEVTR